MSELAMLAMYFLLAAGAAIGLGALSQNVVAFGCGLGLLVFGLFVALLALLGAWINSSG